MKTLTDLEAKPLMRYFQAAAKVANKSTCQRAHCGSVIVNSKGEIIAEGSNNPAGGQESNRSCLVERLGGSSKPKYDTTCCVHAEWQAILRAALSHPKELQGSRLYFMRVDDKGNMTRTGDPLCTVCSRLAMESGISEFIMWHREGVRIYPIGEFDRLSYAFHGVDINENN